LKRKETNSSNRCWSFGDYLALSTRLQPEQRAGLLVGKQCDQR